MLRTYAERYLGLGARTTGARATGINVEVDVKSEQDEKKGPGNTQWYWVVPAVAGGAVAGAVLVPWALGTGLAGMGFTTLGIAKGSLGASAMSTAWTTGVGTGMISLAQSTGAAGVAVGTKVAMATAGGAAAGYYASGTNCEKEKKKN